MHNATHRTRDYPVETRAGQSESQSAAHVSDSANQAVRDFFRKGDRGLYEGGPAELALDSSPGWDLPKRVLIVRTPKQQARRIAAMWAEAVLMLGCVAFLVTAALKASGSSSPHSPTSNAAQLAPPARARTINPQQRTPVEPVGAKASVAAGAAPNVQAAVQSGRVSAPVAPASERSQVHPAATRVTVPERKRAAVTAIAPALHRAPSARQASPTTITRTEATAPTSPVAPKRAVAAFPED